MYSHRRLDLLQARHVGIQPVDQRRDRGGARHRPKQRRLDPWVLLGPDVGICEHVP
jgi:hypothetical protein